MLVLDTVFSVEVGIMLVSMSLIDVRRMFDQHAYLELPYILPDQSYFSDLYAKFDDFARIMLSDAKLAQTVETASGEWLRDRRNRGYFCGVPSRFVDRTPRKDKADKVYFQTSYEFLSYCLKNGIHHAVHGVIEPLFLQLEQLFLDVEKVLVPVVRSLAKEDHLLVGRLLADRRRPAIIIRVLRYEPGPDSGTGPHCDKSALSLILNSDDDYCFVLGQHGCASMAELQRPYRHQSPGGGRTSALVFPGLCLAEAGFTWIKPTVHAVLPYPAARRRHAVVAFLLVPHLDMDHLQTNVLLLGTEKNTRRAA